MIHPNSLDYSFSAITTHTTGGEWHHWYEHLNASSHSSTTKQLLYQDPGECLVNVIVERHIPA